MPNIAALLKQEITRLSRKEVKTAIGPLKKQVASLRQEVAMLKKERTELQRTLKRLIGGRKPAAAAPTAEEPTGRISAAGIKSLRAKFGLSADAFGQLVGASLQSVYNWEKGAKPRRAQLAKILELRGMGKRRVLALLEAVE